MAGDIHVEVLKPEERDGLLRIAARVRGHPRLTRRNGVVFFETPARCAGWLAVRGGSDDVHDAFLRGLIWSAMEAGGDLSIHGRVSTRLLTNLERYQEIVCRWWPAYHPVRIHAEEELSDETAAAALAADPARGGATVLAFSGGLDGCDSLVAHRGGRRGRNTLRIEACVFVHGFDIPLHDGAFVGALRRAAAIAEHFSTELVAARCNLKYLLPVWETAFSAGTAAALSLLERRFDTGLLTVGTAYENLHWIDSKDGSTPWTDHLFSSSTFRVASDLAVTRVEKTERLAGEAEVWRNLRVCWDGDDLATNCGRCEKCIRQMLCMRACGIEDFSAFSVGLSPAAVRAATLPMGVVEEEWQRCWEHAAGRGLQEDEIFVAMKEVLDRSAGATGADPTNRAGRLARVWRRRARRLLAAVRSRPS